MAIQVAYNLTAENFDREIGGLLETKNSLGINSLYLLVYDSDIKAQVPEGIVIIPVWKWLLNLN